MFFETELWAEKPNLSDDTPEAIKHRPAFGFVSREPPKRVVSFFGFPLHQSSKRFPETKKKKGKTCFGRITFGFPLKTRETHPLFNMLDFIHPE